MFDKPAFGAETGRFDCGQECLTKKIERRRPGIVRAACYRDGRGFVGQKQSRQDLTGGIGPGAVVAAEDEDVRGPV